MCVSVETVAQPFLNRTRTERRLPSPSESSSFRHQSPNGNHVTSNRQVSKLHLHVEPGRNPGSLVLPHFLSRRHSAAAELVDGSIVFFLQVPESVAGAFSFSLPFLLPPSSRVLSGKRQVILVRRFARNGAASEGRQEAALPRPTSQVRGWKASATSPQIATSSPLPPVSSAHGFQGVPVLIKSP